MSRLLKGRFLLVICIAGVLLTTSMVSYAQDDVSLTPVLASTILERVCTEDGASIEYDSVRVLGSLDFSSLPEYGCTDYLIPVLFKITNSVIEGDLITVNQNSEVRFQESVNFTGTTFEGLVMVGNTVFEGNVNFDAVVFEQIAAFGMTTFERATSFNLAQFRQGATLSEMTFQQVNFLLAEFYDAPLFQNVNFAGPADFTESKFIAETETIFTHCTFAETVFSQAEFNADVAFLDTTFTSDVSFRSVSFKNADFNGAEFISSDSVVTFWLATFESADFSGARFKTSDSDVYFHDGTFGYANFSGARFNSEVSFTSSTFENADFSETRFMSDAIFEKARFNSGGNFQDAAFNGEANFRGASFTGSFDLEGSFLKEIKLTGITISPGELNLFGIDLTETDFTAHDFDPDWVKRFNGDFTLLDTYGIYAELVPKFRDQSREPLANELVNVMRSIQCDETEQWSSTYFGCRLAEPVGHFVSVGRVLVLSGLAILICGALYFPLRAKKETSKTVTLRVPAAKIVEKELQGNELQLKTTVASDDSQTDTNWFITGLGYFVLSIAVFFSPRRVKTQTAWNHWLPKDILLPLLVWTEWILGWYLLIALAATLTGTYPPLRDLIISFR